MSPSNILPPPTIAADIVDVAIAVTDAVVVVVADVAGAVSKGNGNKMRLDE